MEVKSKTLTCPICSNEIDLEYDKKVLYNLSDEDKDALNRPKSIYFCKGCDVGIAYPRFTEEQIEEIYTKGEYWKEHDPEIFTPRKSLGLYTLAESRWHFVKTFLLEIKTKKTISILDIGAGHGYFGMVAAKDKNFEISEYCAVEMDGIFRKSLQMTWNKFYPLIKFSVCESIETVQGAFDVVVLSHVLEHLNHPEEMLKTIKSLLKPGGIVFIDIPYRDYRFKKDIFPHVLFYDIPNLQKLCEKAGFNFKRAKYYGHEISRSPLNYKNENNLLAFFDKAIYKFRNLIPEWVYKRFFAWYYGIYSQKQDGTWIRAIMTK